MRLVVVAFLLLASWAATPRGSVQLFRTVMDPSQTGQATGTKLLEATPPAYPESALRDRLQGEAVVGLDVATDGTVSKTSIRRSSGHVALDDAALAAGRTFKYPSGRAYTDVIRFVYKLD